MLWVPMTGSRRESRMTLEDRFLIIPLLPSLPSPPSASSTPGESQNNKTGNHYIPTKTAKIKKKKKTKPDNTT